MTEISVIIPVYNVEEYLEECLDSVLSQTFQDIELICINDGSKDNSLKILEQYQKMDSRIKIFSQENKGLSSARNKGISEAEGKYIYFLDSDDYISNIALKSLYDNAQENDSDIVISNYLNANEVQKIYNQTAILQFIDEKIFSFDKNTLKETYYKLLPVAQGGKFYRTSLIKDLKFCEDIIFEDVVYCAQTFLKANKITYLPETFYYYRTSREGSITNEKSEKFFDIIKVIKKTKQAFIESGYWEKYKYEIELNNIMNLIFILNKINQNFIEKFFNMIKSLNYSVDYNYYLNENYSPTEKRYLYLFNQINSLDYETFKNKYLINKEK